MQCFRLVGTDEFLAWIVGRSYLGLFGFVKFFPTVADFWGLESTFKKPMQKISLYQMCSGSTSCAPDYLLIITVYFHLSQGHSEGHTA